MQRRIVNGGKALLLASSFHAAAMVPFAPANAQQSSAGAAVQEEPRDEVSDIIVTARRRGESIQDIPISISAIGEQELQRRNVDTLADYAASVPGVSYIDEGPTGTRGSRTLVVRGISSQNTGGSVSQGTVGFYLDESPVPVLDPQIFDVNRIEILKGPQSTLYGAGSVGGTFRVITNQPRLDVVEGSGEVAAEITRHGDPSYEVKGAINLPVVPGKVAVRGVAWYEDRGGWVDNYPLGDATPEARIQRDWNDVRVAGGRVSALIQATDRLSFTPSAMYQRIDEDGSTLVDPRLPGYRSRNQITNPRSDESFQLYSFVARYDLGFAEITSATSKFYQHLSMLEDASGSQGIPIPPATFADTPDQSMEIRPESFTQEVRLVSSGDNRLDWTVGLFYNKSESDLFFQHEQAGVFPIPLIYQLDQKIGSSEKAIYGELSFDITDRLTLAGGLRYFNVKTNFTNTTSGFLGSGVTSGNSSETGVRPKVYLSYDVTDDAMVYGTASQGFRAGGGLATFPVAQCKTGLELLGLFPQPTSFRSDSVWNYEVGAKTSWMQRRLTLNGALFYLDWSDIQQTFPIGSGCPFQITANTGEAVSKGFEIDAHIAPAEGLSFDFSLGYTKAEITEPPLRGAGVKGDRLLNVPNLNIHAAGQYEFPLTGSLNGLARIDYTFVDEKSFTLNRALIVQELDEFHLVNARLGLASDRWEAALYVQNLFNVKGQTDATVGSLVAGRTQHLAYDYIRPRTIGISLSSRF